MIVKTKLCLMSVVLCFAGCVSAVDNKDRGKLPESYALKGTKTAVVGIAIDNKGIPLETVSAVILKPGQRAVFAGPDEFQIIFKDKKSPSRQLQYRSSNGVITIDVPKDIIDRSDLKDEFEKNRQVRFNYAIKIKDRELDPPFIVKRDD